MPDWSLGYAQRLAAAGSASGSSGGTTITTDIGSNSKGTWYELISSTPFDAQGIVLNFGWLSATITLLMDLGIGAAGSEQVIIPNLFTIQDGNKYIGSIYLPLRIPAGTRIAARCQASTGANSCKVAVTLINGAFDTPIGGTIMTAYGPDTSTSDVVSAVPSATNNVKGSWLQLTSSTTRDHNGLVLALGSSGITVSVCNWLLDIGIGAGGSEVVVIPDIFIVTNTSTNCFPLLIYFPIQIPAGTRIAARCQSSTARNLRIAAYGLS